MTTNAPQTRKPKRSKRQWRSKKVMLGNCFLWAIRQWWRRGGYICFRKIRACGGACLHSAWLSPDMHLYHWRPVNRQLAWWKYPLHYGFIGLGEDAL